MSDRILARIIQIDNVIKHENSDNLDLAYIGGWQVVVRRGEYKRGDIACYLEIDSWVPTQIAEFLSKGKEPREYNNVKGERLKTARLRGEISQGLILPLSVIPEDFRWKAGIVGDDLTEILGIQKWERPEWATLSADQAGLFYSGIQKTDEERIQNFNRELDKMLGKRVVIREKADGSSMTSVYNVETDTFHVCSRNFELKPDENNVWWKMAYQYKIEEGLRSVVKQLSNPEIKTITLQNEVLGASLNGNHYKLNDQRILAFTVQINGKKTNDYMFVSVCEAMNIPMCPLVSYEILEGDVKSLLSRFDGIKSLINPSVSAEGVVVRLVDDHESSFKIISNKYLIETDG